MVGYQLGNYSKSCLTMETSIIQHAWLQSWVSKTNATLASIKKGLTKKLYSPSLLVNNSLFPGEVPLDSHHFLRSPMWSQNHNKNPGKSGQNRPSDPLTVLQTSGITFWKSGGPKTYWNWMVLKPCKQWGFQLPTIQPAEFYKISELATVVKSFLMAFYPTSETSNIFIEHCSCFFIVQNCS